MSLIEHFLLCPWLDSGMSDPFAIHVPLTLSFETASRGRALEVNTPTVLILSTDVFLTVIMNSP